MKLKKYFFHFSSIFQDLFYKNRIVYYTPDIHLIFFLILFKRFFKKKKWEVIYHQFELIEPHQLGKIEKFEFQFILNNIQYVNWSVFPEKNRIEYFKSLVHKEFNYELFPNTCHVNKELDLVFPKEFHNIPKTHKIIGHIGNLGENHYLNFYIELIEQCKNDLLTFVFIGRFSDKLLKRLKSIENSNVVIVNEVPHRELKYYYYYIQYGVILYKGVDLNFEYCAPNKLYEYWSYGIPVIAHSLKGLTSLEFSTNMGSLYNFEDQISLSLIKDYLQTNIVNRQGIKHEFIEKFDLSLFKHAVDVLLEK